MYSDFAAELVFGLAGRYAAAVKVRCCRHAGLAVAIGLLLSGPAAHAKHIRLQNETIETKAIDRSKPDVAYPAANRGLFLVQFTQPPGAELRRSLAANGVELLAAVPEDAFIARVRGAKQGWFSQFGTVEWVGPYKPEHKLHRDLLRVRQGPSKQVSVRVLLAPGATESEKAGVRGILDAVEQESALPVGTILKGRMSSARLSSLQQSDTVLWIEPARPMKLFDEVSSKIVAGDAGPNYLFTQSLGYDGSGVRVAVADSGLNNGDAASMHPDLLGRTPAFLFYGTGELTDAADEHSHGTHVAGIIAGNGATSEMDENGFLYGLGVAPGASIIAQRIFDGVGNYVAPPSYERLTRDAKRAGADVGSNSWGDDTQGQYDLSAMEFDALVRDCDALNPGDQGYILEFSAGNAGPAVGSIGSPAVAKNVIATGASENDRIDFLIYGDGPETMADFSSRGPCKDGRIKPDLVAPGTYIASLQSASATDEYAWAPISSYYQYQGGTSQAGPHVSGAAAVFVQYYRQTHGGATPSPALVKAALINSAVDMYDDFGTGPVPNMDEGWGRVDLQALFDPGLQFDYLDQTALVANGQSYEKHVVVEDVGEPLKITLTYTDVPGIPSAAVALVNDLDLEVVGPDGTIYRGNQFAAGESVPNAPASDHINNVEGVLIGAPLPGEYLVRVRAVNVESDARAETELVDQDFALVVSGLLAAPGRAVISMDRTFYRAPDTIKLFLVDADLVPASSVSVQVSSGAEPSGEQVVLHANGGYGAFTGMVFTAAGPATSDGILQVADGNMISAEYDDSSSGSVRTAEAVADLTAPILSGVAFRVSFASPVISWTSSEPATSIVQFGTNPSDLNRAVTNLDLTTQHEVFLGRVTAGTTYYYYVISSDEAGNLSTNNNSGAFYTFLVAGTKPLLFVDAWPDDPLLLGAPDPAEYTNALAMTGIDFDMWETATMGSPTNVLASYRGVVWRFPELGDAWNESEKYAVSNYLHNGGAMFIASMELMSRLSDPVFSKNVLHVESFVSDEEGSGGVSDVTGEPLDPVAQGFSAVLDYAVYDELWIDFGGLLPSDISDTIFPDNEASTMLFDETNDSVGLRWPGLGKEAPGRLILLSFPLDALPMDSSGGPRVDLLRRAFSFLIPGASHDASIRFGSAAYQVPGRAMVDVGDSDLVGQFTLDLHLNSSSQPAGLQITLTSPDANGEFTGGVSLVTSPEVGKLLTADGDTLTVEYFDASSGSTVTATAAVDNVPPVISSVAGTADYVDAEITWDTSEPTDSQVVFGESPLLGRTAYDASLKTSHSVSLNSLVPNRTYYYKIVCRDAGGNVGDADNGGTLFTFTTQAPLLTPWADNMDTGASNWTTYADDELLGPGGSGNWTLGVPANGVETQAHSQPYCWGSNLQNDPLDLAECFLISPAVYIEPGKAATLTFWHNYDFYDYSGYDLEFGFLQVSVNNGPLQDLASYSDSSFGWEQETIDLTPFAGNMIYLAWHYLLFAFDAGARPGWLVDDVAISSVNVNPGMVMVTNNIWQAEYVLSGPLFKKGKGPITITNAPPGEYYLEFAPVPYYQTPASQTNTLFAGGTLMFTGTYGFADANSNGISDEWETAFFGVVSTNRTAQSNSDEDKMTDYAEFVVGTDPLSPRKPFVLSAVRASANSVQMSWTALAGETFTVQASTNTQVWEDEIQSVVATSTVCSVTVPIQAGPGARLFRVVNTSAADIPAIPDRLILNLQPLPGGGLRFSWRTPNGCGYCLESSEDLQTWTPASPWIRATARTTSYDLSSVSGARRFYRLRAEP